MIKTFINKIITEVSTFFNKIKKTIEGRLKLIEKLVEVLFRGFRKTFREINEHIEILKVTETWRSAPKKFNLYPNFRSLYVGTLTHVNSEDWKEFRYKNPSLFTNTPPKEIPEFGII